MTVLTVLITCGALAVSAIIIYLYILGLNGILVFRKNDLSPQSDNKKFLVFVPAHNEDVVIKNVIGSIRQTDYDQDLIDVIVIADNCTDSTAGAAVEVGAKVLERIDQTRLGKGYAIEWALKNVDIANYDAVTVIDADNIVEKNFFKVTAGLLDSGKEVIQAYYGFYNVAKTTYSYILYLANLIENYLLYNSRSNLKLHTFLRGSGMTFKTELLSEVRWHSESITEDVNYSIELMIANKKIHFTTATRVREEALSYISQSFNQRLRYNTGVISLAKHNFIRLFFLSIRRKDLLLMEASISFLLLSKPLLLTLSVFLLAVGLILGLSNLILIVCLINIVAVFMYFVLGLFLKPEKGPLVKSILISPVYGIWLIVIYVLSSLGYKKGVWARTPRASETNNNTMVM